MIKNERQYRITKAQAEKFEQALARAAAEPAGDGHPMMRQMQIDALRSQLAELREQIDEYEALRSGARAVLQLESFEELPRALIQSRIAARLSQKDLAERLSLKEQQVQRYEATEYASASLERIQEVIRALGIRVREDIFLPHADVSPAVLFKRLEGIGYSRNFVLKRLLPRSLSARLQQRRGENNGTEGLVLQAANIVGRVIRKSAAEILGTRPLNLEDAVSGSMRYKVPAGANASRLRAYTVYAHHLSLLALDVTTSLPTNPIPTSAREARRAILAKYGEVTFENVLRYAWSLGIVVLPLRDRGTFHGACFREDGRNVIVLKQQTEYAARWLFDLLHELWHAGEDPEQKDLHKIEGSEMSEERRNSREERAASQFAGNVLLDCRAQGLAELCAEESGRNTPWLKKALRNIAARENIPLDALANYMAFRMSLEGEEWWSTASTLQENRADLWQVARDVFLEHANFDCLNEVDRDLLLQALSDNED